MTTVDTTVTISVNPGGESLEELEARVGQALQRAGPHLLSEACRQMETELLQARALLFGAGNVATCTCSPASAG